MSTFGECTGLRVLTLHTSWHVRMTSHALLSFPDNHHLGISNLTPTLVMCRQPAVLCRKEWPHTYSCYVQCVPTENLGYSSLFPMHMPAPSVSSHQLIFQIVDVASGVPRTAYPFAEQMPPGRCSMYGPWYIAPVQEQQRGRRRKREPKWRGGRERKREPKKKTIGPRQKYVSDKVWILCSVTWKYCFYCTQDLINVFLFEKMYAVFKKFVKILLHVTIGNVLLFSVHLVSYFTMFFVWSRKISYRDVCIFFN